MNFAYRIGKLNRAAYISEIRYYQNLYWIVPATNKIKLVSNSPL